MVALRLPGASDYDLNRLDGHRAKSQGKHWEYQLVHFFPSDSSLSMQIARRGSDADLRK